MSLLIGFSGQGQQYQAMFHLLKQDTWGQSWLQACSKLIGFDLSHEANIAKYCDDALYSQLFITSLSVGTFRAIAQRRPLQALLCGYSLGELSAFCASTALPLTSIFDIVEKRVQCMQAALDNYDKDAGMIALKGHINLNDAKKLIQTYNCHIAIINDNDHYIIGGFLADLEKLKTAAKKIGVSLVKSIKVKFPSHTPLLANASIEFHKYLQTYVQSAKMTIPILNAMTAERVEDTVSMLAILAKELSQPLHWDKIMHMASDYQIDTWLELGPQRALTHMFIEANPYIKAYASDDFITMNGVSMVI